MKTLFFVALMMLSSSAFADPWADFQYPAGTQPCKDTPDDPCDFYFYHIPGIQPDEED